MAWWFAGTADLSVGRGCSAGTFGRAVGRFLDRVGGMRARYRVDTGYERRRFLAGCLQMNEGGVRDDRERSFAFMGDVVDGLLPAYLPLLEGAWGDAGEERGEEVERFCIQGGAKCESAMLRGEAFGSWRFSLAPSSLTSAGRVYDSLRNDGGAAEERCLYM